VGGEERKEKGRNLLRKREEKGGRCSVKEVIQRDNVSFVETEEERER